MRGNAMWRGVELIIVAIITAIKPVLEQVWREPFHYLNAGLLLCAIILFVAAILQFRRASRTRVLNGAQTHALDARAVSDRDPQPGIVALDELKELLREGGTMFARYYVKQEPTRGEVDDYRLRTRACARQKALASVVSIKDLARFDESFETERELQSRILRKKVELADTGYDDFDGETFDLLYERIARLNQLIAAVESTEENQSRSL
jgi:hypothetical protein